MMLSRQKFRDLILQTLFSLLLFPEQKEDVCEILSSWHHIPEETTLEIFQRANAILITKDYLDEIIQKYSKNYTLDKINFMEKAILYQAFFTLKNEVTLPPVIIIAEALRLSKRYVTKDTVRFINAVLDSYVKSMKSITDGPSTPLWEIVAVQ